MAKRGESIVEVVVACGILSILFSAVATMIMGTVGLNNDARVRMEEVALAQTKLNDFMVTGGDVTGLSDGTCKIQPGVSIAPGVDTPVSGDIPVGNDAACSTFAANDATGLLGYFGILGKTECDYVSVRSLSNSETGSGLDANSFVVVESHVRWVGNSTGTQEYIIQQLVAK